MRITSQRQNKPAAISLQASSVFAMGRGITNISDFENEGSIDVSVDAAKNFPAPVFRMKKPREEAQ